jgi:hypothetical protein
MDVAINIKGQDIIVVLLMNKQAHVSGLLQLVQRVKNLVRPRRPNTVCRQAHCQAELLARTLHILHLVLQMDVIVNDARCKICYICNVCIYSYGSIRYK